MIRIFHAIVTSNFIERFDSGCILYSPCIPLISYIYPLNRVYQFELISCVLSENRTMSHV
jgi:hypothetical protein